MRRSETRPRNEAELPRKLEDFLLRGWSRHRQPVPRRAANAVRFLRRRERLSRRFPGDLLVVPTGHLQVRANDTHYAFRPGSDFYYLTGASAPDCVLALVPRGKRHDHVLFVEPTTGRQDVSFFTDRQRGELWVGHRPGIAESEARYGMTARPLADLKSLLESFRARHAGARIRVLLGRSVPTEKLLGRGIAREPSRHRELAECIAEMRLIKDADEVKALQSAVAATQRGFEDVIVALQSAHRERELEAAFWRRARSEGRDVGYPSIVAAGAHACTLHWTRNDGLLRRGELLLLDAGVEGDALYTADITRTLPMSGRFTREQRAVYDIVLDARRAALSLVKPGSEFMQPNDAAMRVLAAGLERLGILPVPAREALAADNQFYRRYTLHNVSHMLGLDVHDCANARAQTYKRGKLQAGMVLTVEPGLYLQPDDLTVPLQYRGIGVRLEDDVLVTARGHRCLSASLPIEPDEVEAWMHHIWAASFASSRLTCRKSARA